jgi:protocatechuate 3,4-dioxygenase beta subunit
MLAAATTSLATITGTLIDESGKPAAGAAIRAYAAEDSAPLRSRAMRGKTLEAAATAQSADNGSFRIESPAPLTLLVIAAKGKVDAAFETGNADDLGIIVLHSAPGEKMHFVAGGKPVQNAAVIAGPFSLRTDATGAVELPEINGAVARMMVVHPDFAITNSHPIDDSGNAILSPGTSIRGRVLSADGQPVANAAIVVEGWPAAQSGADGSFIVAHAPPAWRTLTAADATRAAMVTNIGAKSYDIKLQPAATITGVTTPGARIAIITDLTRQHVDYVLADGAGRFTIGPLPPGRYNLRASRSGYTSAAAEVPLTAGAHVVRNLAMKPLGKMRVRVVGEDQKPIAGAFVWDGFAGFTGFGLASTGDDGIATVRRTTESTTLHMIFAVKPGYAIGALENPPEGKDLSLTLPRGFPLRIHVIDRQRQNVAGAIVMTSVNTGNGGFHYMAACEDPLARDCRKTGDDGIVKVRATEGAYDVRVSGESVALTGLPQTLTPKSDPLTIEVDRGVAVSGRVAFSDGTPIPNAQVTLQSLGSSVRTRDDGTFTMRNLPSGKIALVAVTADQLLRSAPTEANAPARNVAITIPSPGRIEGRVTDKDAGQPIADFMMTVVFRDGRAGSGGRPASFHSDDGTFVLDNLGAGPIRLQIGAAGYAPATIGDLTVEEGKTIRDVQIRLERGGRVHGKATANGQPVAGVNVRFGNAGFFGPNLSATQTDDNGEYTIEGIALGDQRVDFMKEGFLMKHKTVTIERGKDATVDIEMERGKELRGRVVDKAGRAIAGARVWTTTMGPSGVRPVTSDAEGNFALEGLDDGRYTVNATKDGYVTGRTNDVVVPAQTPITVTLDTGGTITGRVRGLSDPELMAASVFASGAGSNANARVSPDGTFTLRGVPDGRVTVFATVRAGLPRESTRKVVDVANGSAPGVDIDFTEGITITGRVTRSGVPYGGGNLNFSNPKLGSRSGPISPDGRYQIDGLAAGDYDVVIFGMNGPVFRGKYSVAANSVYDIQIQGATLRGHVVDASTGAPIAGASVWTQPSRDNPMMRQTTTDSDGSFLLEPIPDGSVEVHASSRQHYAPAVQTVTVSGGVASDIEFRLEAGQATAFRVVDAQTGAPMDAFISVSSGKTMTANGGPTRDDDGAIRLYLAPGSYKAFVNARGYIQQTVDFIAPASEVRVVMAVAGRVQLLSAKPTRVRLTSPTAPRQYNGMASPNGFTMENLAPGNYTLEVYAEDGKTVVKSIPVTVNAGLTTTVNVD